MSDNEYRCGYVILAWQGWLRRSAAFTDVTAEAGVAKQSNSFAAWFFDYDNDGIEGNGKFRDVSVASGIAGPVGDMSSGLGNVC